MKFTQHNLMGLHCFGLGICFSLLSVETSEAAITILWAENAGDGNDVTATFSGMYTFTDITGLNYVNQNGAGSDSTYQRLTQNQGGSGGDEMLSLGTGFTWDYLTATTAISGSSSLQNNFADYAEMSTMNDSIGFDLLRADGSSRIYLPGSWDSIAGKTWTPSGTMTFSNTNFANLFASSDETTFLNMSVNGTQILTSAALPVPEPSSLWCMMLGGALVALQRRRHELKE